MANLCIMELVLWEILKATFNNPKRSSGGGIQGQSCWFKHSEEEELLSDSD